MQIMLTSRASLRHLASDKVSRTEKYQIPKDRQRERARQREREREREWLPSPEIRLVDIYFTLNIIWTCFSIRGGRTCSRNSEYSQSHDTCGLKNFMACKPKSPLITFGLSLCHDRHKNIKAVLYSRSCECAMQEVNRMNSRHADRLARNMQNNTVKNLKHKFAWDIILNFWEIASNRSHNHTEKEDMLTTLTDIFQRCISKIAKDMHVQICLIGKESMRLEDDGNIYRWCQIPS